MTETEKILYQQLGTDWWLQINEQPYFGHVIKAIEEARRIGQKLPIGDELPTARFKHNPLKEGGKWLVALNMEVEDGNKLNLLHNKWYNEDNPPKPLKKRISKQRGRGLLPIFTINLDG